MKRHLIPIPGDFDTPDRESLIRAGLSDVVAEFFAEKIVAGEVFYNLATGAFVDVNVATEEETEAAIVALRDYFYTLDTLDGHVKDAVNASIFLHLAYCFATDVIAGRIAGRLIWNPDTGTFIKADWSDEDAEMFRASAVDATKQFLLDRGNAEAEVTL